METTADVQLESALRLFTQAELEEYCKQAWNDGVNAGWKAGYQCAVIDYEATRSVH